MRTYKEYYSIGVENINSWLALQKEEWWRKDENDGLFDIKGEYIEGVDFLTNYKKNDVSLFANHTNVLNSKWNILFDMLGQIVIDWCLENDKEIYKYNIDIHRRVGEYEYYHKLDIITGKFSTIKSITDPVMLEEFSGCSEFICDIVDQFISENWRDIPIEWNHFGFSLDNLSYSCKFRVWTPYSDGYMCLGNDSGEYIEFVNCM